MSHVFSEPCVKAEHIFDTHEICTDNINNIKTVYVLTLTSCRTIVPVALLALVTLLSKDIGLALTLTSPQVTLGGDGGRPTITAVAPSTVFETPGVRLQVEQKHNTGWEYVK